MGSLRGLHKSLDEQLHKKGIVSNLLEIAESKTKISRVNLVYGFVAIVVLYLIFGYGTSFLASFIGFVYPAYRSIKALETLDKEDDTKWLTYWVVFSAVSVLESFTDIFFYWIPLYSLIKCAVFIFMMIPTRPNGSSLIYERVIRPYVLKNERKIDDALNHASDIVGDFSRGVKKMATEAVVDHFNSKED